MKGKRKTSKRTKFHCTMKEEKKKRWYQSRWFSWVEYLKFGHNDQFVLRYGPNLGQSIGQDFVFGFAMNTWKGFC